MVKTQVVAALENVDVECTFCGVTMTAHLGSGARVRYFRCPGCSRWVTSSYTDVFRADAKVRTCPKREVQAPGTFAQVKERLERWLSSLDRENPYRTLGVTPADSMAAVRDRYLKLAHANHPDRGGSAETMGRINAAYERIRDGRDRESVKALRALPQVA